MAPLTPLGEGYRGPQGRLGYLLVQAHHAFATAMDDALREAKLSRPQFGTLSVVVAEPGLSSADLARAVMVTPQAVNLLVTGLEQEGLVERRAHPTHGRILQIYPTEEGERRVRATYPIVTDLEDRIAEGLSERQLASIKRWLVRTAETMQSARESRGRTGHS
jgi:DNA-binding MarR family transcriptional regulator